ncbi:hypothetical protein AQUSIP_22760 [Aquicella siphonis]|uniref:Carboxypeptidase regulatory-like domain-containing protein n=1 Tax=Aquicella siphonis TaxID=254247 RepID=A0A5E4PIQ9_9COXI|nr:carboxypeptidase regulatory-like domain-containing protein [Aquicella siphonis]VVC76949.1 hypothetical protein AQUSIP_22760 [Aquicella siphonis]
MLIVKTQKWLAICAVVLSTLSSPASAAEEFAPVSGFARSFILGTELSDATITVLESGLKLKTDSHGRFGPFLYPVGKPITLLFEKWGYKTTQSGTFIVPRDGLTGPHDNITFQIPSIETYYLLSTIIGVDFDKNSCHVVTTVMAYGKTLDDPEQGEPGAKITLTPSVNVTPFYFDIFEEGPLKGKTNPFTKGLTLTTRDGGVGFYNLPPREEPYTLSAEKNGVMFTQARFICRKDVFINISPPGGPMATQ